MKNDPYLMQLNTITCRTFQSLDTFDSSLQQGSCPQQSISDEALPRLIARAVDRTIENGVAIFRREIMLPRLIPVAPDEMADHSAAGRSRIVRRLAKSLRGERTRGRSGHWTYSLDRHIGLLQAFKAERAALRQLQSKAIDIWRG
jgi:hypothetical protein